MTDQHVAAQLTRLDALYEEHQWNSDPALVGITGDSMATLWQPSREDYPNPVRALQDLALMRQGPRDEILPPRTHPLSAIAFVSEASLLFDGHEQPFMARYIWSAAADRSLCILRRFQGHEPEWLPEDDADDFGSVMTAVRLLGLALCRSENNPSELDSFTNVVCYTATGERPQKTEKRAAPAKDHPPRVRHAEPPTVTTAVSHLRLPEGSTK